MTPEKEKQIDEIIDFLKRLKKVADAAKAFVHYPENWESFEDLKTSNSASIPAEFMLLCEAVEDFFGPPVGDDIDRDEALCRRCEHALSAADGLCIKKMYGHACSVCNGLECRA